jgi:small subunit ribosomal protein S1
MSSDPRESSPEQMASETPTDAPVAQSDQSPQPVSPQPAGETEHESGTARADGPLPPAAERPANGDDPAASPPVSGSSGGAQGVPQRSSEPPLRRVLQGGVPRETAPAKPATSQPAAGQPQAATGHPQAATGEPGEPSKAGSDQAAPGDKPRGRQRSDRRGPRQRGEKEQARREPVDRPPRTVAPPSVRRPLPAELEQELESAFDGLSMDSLVAAGSSVKTGTPLEVDSRHSATLMKIHGDNVFFSLGGRNEGVASLRQFDEPPEIGAVLDVVVTGFNLDDGLYEVRIPGASIQVQDWSDLAEGAVVEARITGSNTGGLECMVGGIRGFIPASQIETFRVEQFADYHDQKLTCVVTEANERRGNLVLSHRALVEREKEEQRQQLLEELEVGDVREGTVTSLRDFGAFVDLGGIDGLIHISQLSWDRVAHPKEVLEAGQKVSVKVEKVDRQTGKIGLSYRDLLEHPWTHAEEQFAVDAVVRGTVTRTMDFGAFVKLGPGIEGLVHISELAHHRVVNVTNVVKEGDEVEVKILSIDPDAQRIGLSLKDAHPMPEAEKPLPPEGAEDAEQEPPPKPVVPPRSGPLKGGMDRASGGDQIGLKW